MFLHTAVCLCLKEDDLYRLPVDRLLLTVSLPENKAVCDLRIHTHETLPGCVSMVKHCHCRTVPLISSYLNQYWFVLLSAGFMVILLGRWNEKMKKTKNLWKVSQKKNLINWQVSTLRYFTHLQRKGLKKGCDHTDAILVPYRTIFSFRKEHWHVVWRQD